MIGLEAELEKILSEDPLGLLEVKPRRGAAPSVEERLAAAFEEVSAFVSAHGREPAMNAGIAERRLCSRLRALREDPEKVAALKPLDSHGLLVGFESHRAPIETIDDVLERDDLGLLVRDGADDESGILELRHVSRDAPPSPTFAAQRRPCEHFERFEPIFRGCHAALEAGSKKAIPFASEMEIREGKVYLLQGMLVLVAGVGEWEKKNFGNSNRRLYCVFENGTESNLLQRSLAAALWKAEHSREIVDADQLDLEGDEMVSDDRATGYVYVFRSLSNDPKVRDLEHLYKIGFSTTGVEGRVASAEREATFLGAPVSPVTSFATYNLNPRKLEHLLHRFFADARLSIDVTDERGARHSPREWFVVPLPRIEAAVRLLVSGEITNYRYDLATQEIVEV